MTLNPVAIVGTTASLLLELVTRLELSISLLYPELDQPTNYNFIGHILSRTLDNYCTNHNHSYLTHINFNFSHSLNYIDTNQSRSIGSDSSYNCLLDANRIGTVVDAVADFSYNSGLAKVV